MRIKFSEVFDEKFIFANRDNMLYNCVDEKMRSIRNDMIERDPKDYLILEYCSNDLIRGADVNEPSRSDLKYSFMSLAIADIVEYVRPDGVVIYLKHRILILREVIENENDEIVRLTHKMYTNIKDEVLDVGCVGKLKKVNDVMLFYPLNTNYHIIILKGEYEHVSVSNIT